MPSKHKIEVYTDHKNLTYDTEQGDSQCLQYWRSLIQEFNLTLKFIAGKGQRCCQHHLKTPEGATWDPSFEAKLEAELCALLAVNGLIVTEMAECFAIDNNNIDSPLAPHLMEVEQKLKLASDNAQALKIKAGLTNPKSEWEYKDVESRRLRPRPNWILVVNPNQNQSLITHWWAGVFDFGNIGFLPGNLRPWGVQAEMQGFPKSKV